MTLAALVLALSLNASPAAAAPSPGVVAVPGCVPQKAPKKAKLTYPSGKTVTVDVVDTPASRETGLMCRTKLGKDYGMLFVFPQEMALNFWMKNTLVDLDMIWIGTDKRINVIHADMPKSTVETPDDKVAVAGGTGLYVLELPAGAAKRLKLKAGDRLKFSTPIPEK